MSLPASHQEVLGFGLAHAAGLIAGGGIWFELSYRSRISAQVRWHDPTNTTVVPITCGISI